MSEEVKQIAINGNMIGLVGLEAVMGELKAADPRDDAARGDFLLRRVKERNYVPDSVAAAYRAALLEEYKVAVGELTERSDKGPLEVKVLGAGCVNCQTLYKRTMETAAQMNLAADIEYVTDFKAIVAYGVMNTPALVIRGKVVVTGRVPSREEIKKLLEAAG